MRSVCDAVAMVGRRCARAARVNRAMETTVAELELGGRGTSGSRSLASADRHRGKDTGSSRARARERERAVCGKASRGRESKQPASSVLSHNAHVVPAR